MPRTHARKPLWPVLSAGLPGAEWWVAGPVGTVEPAAAGADGAIVLARTTADVDALVGAVERW